MVLAASLLGVAGGLFASLLRLTSPIAFLLATNAIAWGILVAFTLALSTVHEVRSTATWLWLAAVVVIAVGAWWRAGHPRPPTGLVRQSVADAFADGLVRVLAVTGALVVGYLTVLAVVTPENEGDALAYHVARAAFWRQHHGLSFIPNAIESRLNVNPPNAEIGVLFTMLTSGTQRFVGLVQVSALIICVLATVGIARRVGAGPAGAAWAGLLVVTLPVITTQAPTAQNDLVVAAFLATSAFFVLGAERWEPALAGLAFALAIGAKFTAVLCMPLLLLLVLVAAPGRRRWARAVLIAGIGLAAGSVWYVVNLVETGHLDGGLAQSASQYPTSLTQALDSFRRFALNSFDLSGLSDVGWGGVVGINAFLYRGVGFVLILIGLVSLLRHGRTAGSTRLCGSGALILVTPGVVDLAYRALFWLVPVHVAGLANSPNTVAGSTTSWFGPLGVLGVAAGIALAWRGRRGRREGRTTLILAAAPLFLIVWLALTLVWDPSRGRFFIFAYVLAAASWYLMLSERWLSWSVTAVACVTTFAVLANTPAKPLGLRSIDDPTMPAVWGKPDWFVQSILRPGGAEREVIRVADRQIPSRASLALAPRPNDFLSPYFGPDLTRHVDLVLDGHAVDSRDDWLIAAPGVRPVGCRANWRVVLHRTDGWLVAHRRKGTTCDRPARLRVGPGY